VRYSEIKKRLIALLDERFGAARERRKELAKDPAHVDRILAAGAEKARTVARATLSRARRACGID
jgi:tryptophanyl-tRNA synthetase